MPSKGKAKGKTAMEPVMTAVIEEAMAGKPVAAVADPGPPEGVSAPAVEELEQSLTPPLPTQLEAAAGPLAERHTPEEALGVLNGLVTQGVLDKEEFSKIYLHELAPLGATQEDAEKHWDALQEKLQADRAAAEELAAQMVKQATEAPGIQPWNPLEDPTAATAQTEQVHKFFNSMVLAARDERQQAKSPYNTAGYIKDKIVKNLSQSSGLTYAEADEVIHAWAATSSDSGQMSIALQMAAAKKFGLEPPPYIAKQDQKFDQPGAAYAKYKEQARQLVDSMHSATQEWLRTHGIKELVVWRGMKNSIGTSKEVLETIKASDKPVQAAAHLNPMNSWSVSYDKAAQFAGSDGFILSARVPASQVVGSCFTGTGCLNEQEFVVLGGEGVAVSAAYVGKVKYPHVSGWNWELG